MSSDDRIPPQGGSSTAPPVRDRSKDAPRYIVAEVSKNWPENDETPSTHKGKLIAKLFEEVLAANESRGYRLHSFKLDRILVQSMTSDDTLRVNETIIAVFEHERGAWFQGGKS